MITLKKFTQYLIAIGIAALVFSATLVSESTRFFLFSQSLNPFDESVQLEERIEIGEKQRGKELLSSSGEFFIVFPGVKIDFSGDQRKLETGDIFYSSLFLNAEKQQKAALPYEEGDYLEEGQLKIGDMILQAPRSNTFIHRDNDSQYTDIFTLDHPVVLFWNESRHPFVVPANTKVRITDLFTTESKNASYEERKTAFGLQELDREALATSKDPIDKKLILSVSRLDIQNQNMKDFSFYTPEIWSYAGQKTHLVGRILTGISVFQDRFAIGLSENRADQREFNSLVRPFVKANSYIRDRKTALGTRSLGKFKTIMRSVAWKRVLQKNPSIAYEWVSFFVAHNAWMQNDPENDARNFQKAWDSLSQSTAMESMHRVFFSFESFLARDLIKKSREELSEIKDRFGQIEFSNDDAQAVTNLRRLLGEYLQREPLLHDEDSLVLYSLLVKAELQLQEDDQLLRQIKIEVVHRVLPLLEDFLEDRTKIELSRILLQLYQELSIEELIATEGYQILTPQEQELVSFLVLLGNTGLTHEEIQLIKEEDESQKLLGEKISEVLGQQETGEPQETESGQLRNAKYLNELLESIGVPTDDVYFSTNRAQGITTFSGGQWNGLPLSGTFYYPTQFFTQLSVGAWTKEDFHSRFLSGFLLQIEESILEESLEREKKNNETVFISQTTPKAILERKFVQELLTLRGFQIDREKIIILNAEMSRFQISSARLDNRYSLRFVYNSNTQSLEELESQGGEKPIRFKGEVFPLITARVIIPERMESLLEK